MAKKRGKAFYFFLTLVALLGGWTLLVVLDQGPVAVLHDDAAGLSLERADQMAGVECIEQSIPVALGQDEQPRYNLAGQLCSMQGFDSKPLQVLVSGSGYGSAYWDFPYQPDTYSYMRAALRAGYAVFNFDRLGMGNSDHPPGISLDVDTQGYVLSQAITALAANHEFASITVLGHSFGSVTALAQALNFPGQIDGIVLTGYAHNVNPEFGPSMGKSIEVAAFGGPFVGDIFDPMYVVSKAGTRGEAFYTLDNTEPEVVQTDDLTRQTTAAGELISMSTYFADQSKELRVPVFMLLGEDDFVVCGGDLDCSDYDAVLANEQPLFPPEACFELVVLEDTNHNANLHKNAPEAFALMLDWVARRVGSATEGPSQPCFPES